jgi:hypothetical protein
MIFAFWTQQEEGTDALYGNKMYENSVKVMG